MSKKQILFLCTGNICRSPMAEGIFKKYLAEKLCCRVDDLDSIGYKVTSAGIIGMSGFPASDEAVTACATKGIDIRAHRNRGLSEELINESDFIYAMGQVHLRKILDLRPDAASKCVLLAQGLKIAGRKMNANSEKASRLRKRNANLERSGPPRRETRGFDPFLGSSFAFIRG